MMEPSAESRRAVRRLAVMLALWAALCAGWWWWHPRPTRMAQPLRGEAYRIDVNAATAAELRLLPGVGEALAERIVEERTANGPFRDAADLQRVRGIGASVAERSAGLVVYGE